MSTLAKASFLSVVKIAHLFPFNREMGFRLPSTCSQRTRVNLQQFYSWSEHWSLMLLLPSNSSKRPLKFQQTKGNFRHQPSLFSSSALMTDSPTPSKHFRASGSPRAKTTAKLHRKYCSCGGFHQVNKAFIRVLLSCGLQESACGPHGLPTDSLFLTNMRTPIIFFPSCLQAVRLLLPNSWFAVA